MLEYRIKEFIKTQKGNIAVAVKDLKTGEEIKINGNLIFPSASTIKLAIMSELLNRVNEGSISLDDIIELTEEMKTGRLAYKATLFVKIRCKTPYYRIIAIH